MAKTPPCILIADDNPVNVDIFQACLAYHGYTILTAMDGEEALAVAREQQPDLILLDVMMPKMDGIEVCRQLKSDAALSFIPIIMVTSMVDTEDIVAGLEAGADEYIAKPVDQVALAARVKSMLRIKTLHDTVQEQAVQLQVQSTQLAEWNSTLEQRVAEQLAELERVGRLKQFFSPQVAEMIVSSGNARLLESHRREIAVVFCDLRGFTAFAETAEPEDVMRALREYHTAMGALISQFEGILENFSGDGMMIIFNDPFPCADPAVRAVRMAMAMRERAAELAEGWRRNNYHLRDIGMGVALGYATLGQIGFEGRFHYGAIGTVANLASRLCDHAQGGQILVSQRVHAMVEGLVDTEFIGNLSLKGFLNTVPAFNAIQFRGS